MRIQVGLPLATAAPIPEEISPSMPLAPRLARRRTSAPAAGQERLLVADRHARRGVDEVAVGVEAAEGAVEAGLAQLVGRVELGAIAARRLRRPPSHARPSALVAGSTERSASAARQRRRVGANDRAGVRRRLVPAVAGVDDELRGVGQRREPLPQRLAGRHLAEAQDEVGLERVRARRGRSRRRPEITSARSWAPKRSCEVGSARIGSPAAAASAAISAAAPGRPCGRRRSGRAARPARRSASASTSVGGAGGGAGGTVGQRAVAATLERERARWR